MDSRKFDGGGELGELDPVDDLPVHVEREELGRGVLRPVGAVPDPDGGPGARQEDGHVGGKLRVGVLQHEVSREAADVAHGSVGHLCTECVIRSLPRFC